MPTIYKIFREDEWRALQSAGRTAGAPVDLADGYIHFSTAATLAATAAKYFAGVEGLWLISCDADALGDAVKWEAARGGDLFPHLYRELLLSEVTAARPMPVGADGAHVLGDLD